MEFLTIKGLREGTTSLLNDQAPFQEVVWAVEKGLSRASSFFCDSQVVLHFGSRLLNKEEWRDLKEFFYCTDKHKVAFSGQTGCRESSRFVLRGDR